ncbi:hypothetical protein B9X95_05215 [Acinetobacter baumannii]|uniref:Uncharacterized protein n=1 Tax=Acinetobacter baumannii TaxID=470 RepID=A0A241ZGK1_ACIBA|nr:hypothetical protein B9X95_05215 [Acinetobacter baumannii]HAV5486330.1 hypothetical protein [Acinetobacter baumannii]
MFDLVLSAIKSIIQAVFIPLIYKDLNNKKAQHPVGLFYIFDAFGITPVVPAFSVAVFSYSYLEHSALYVPMIGN